MDMCLVISLCSLMDVFTQHMYLYVSMHNILRLNAWLNGSFLENKHSIQVHSKFFRLVKWTWLLIFKIIIF